MNLSRKGRAYLLLSLSGAILTLSSLAHASEMLPDDNLTAEQPLSNIEIPPPIETDALAPPGELRTYTDEQLQVLGINENEIRNEKLQLLINGLDPLEALNRQLFKVNQGLLFVLKAPADVYTNNKFTLPLREVLSRIGDAFDNMEYPVRLVSNLLVLDVSGMGRETARFVVNTTVGLGGLFDASTHMSQPKLLEPVSLWQRLINPFRAGLKWLVASEYQELNDAFNKWGMSCMFYLEIPILGPTSGRKGLANLLEDPLDPTSYTPATLIETVLKALSRADNILRSAEDANRILELALEPYIVAREVILNRHKCLEPRDLPDHLQLTDDQLRQLLENSAISEAY